jgi:hypothetical protein
MPDFVVKVKKLQQCEAICENLEATWKELKYKKGKDHYYSCHIIATMVVSTKSSSNMQATGSFVWLNYISIQQAMEHMQILNNEIERMKRVKLDKKQQSDAINENVKQIVIRWWIYRRN